MKYEAGMLNFAPVCVRVLFLQLVKEYERAVILRLGRLYSRKAKGPGEILRDLW